MSGLKLTLGIKFQEARGDGRTPMLCLMGNDESDTQQGTCSMMMVILFYPAAITVDMKQTWRRDQATITLACLPITRMFTPPPPLDVDLLAGFVNC